MSVELSFRGRGTDPDKREELVRAAAEESGGATIETPSKTKRVVRFGDRLPLDLSFGRLRKDGSRSVKGFCQTTFGGPGLHAAVVDFADGLGLDGLSFSDATGYATHRDFDRLVREAFLPQLKAFATIAARSEGDGSPLFFCWDGDPDGFHPASPGDALYTPTGVFPKTAWRDALARDGAAALADRVFLWPHRRFDATARRNLALLRIWTECAFRPSAESASARADNDAVLDLLEAVRAEDPSLPLPLASYAELCRLAGREPAFGAGASAGSSALDEPPAPGYRRGPVDCSIAGITISLPPGMRLVKSEMDDDGIAWQCGAAGEERLWLLWFTAFVSEEAAAAELDPPHLDDFPYGRETRDVPNGKAFLAWGPADDGGYVATARVVSGIWLYVVRAFFREASEWPDVRSRLLRIRCDGPGGAPFADLSGTAAGPASAGKPASGSDPDKKDFVPPEALRRDTYEFKFFSLAPWTDPALWTELLRRVQDTFGIEFTKMGQYEPLRTPFGSPEEAAARLLVFDPPLSESDWFMVGRPRGTYFSARHYEPGSRFPRECDDIRGCNIVDLSIPAGTVQKRGLEPVVRPFLLETAVRLRAFFAEADLNSTMYQERDWPYYQIGTEFPTLSWLTFYSPAVVRFFGEDKFRRLPIRAELGPHGVLLEAGTEPVDADLHRADKLAAEAILGMDSFRVPMAFPIVDRLDLDYQESRDNPSYPGGKPKPPNLHFPSFDALRAEFAAPAPHAESGDGAKEPAP